MIRFLPQVFHFKDLMLKLRLYGLHLAYFFNKISSPHLVKQSRLMPIKIGVQRGFIIFLMLLSCQVYAQQSNQQGTSTKSAQMLEKLTDEERSGLIQTMINSSRDIEIPADKENQFKDFFSNMPNGPKLYIKYRTLYVVLFNQQLPKNHRVMMCNFILENMNGAEFPLELVVDIKQSFIKSTK